MTANPEAQVRRVLELADVCDYEADEKQRRLNTWHISIGQAHEMAKEIEQLRRHAAAIRAALEAPDA